MIRKFTFLFLIAIVTLSARAGFTPVTVTGFNKDVVANGTGPVRSSAVAVDDKKDTTGYSFNTQDYRSPANVAPTYYLPQNGLISSAATSGLTYQLASYSANNSLRLDTTGNVGTLTLTNPVNASDIYLLATAGGAGTSTSNADLLITFTDNTTATATLAARDWYNYTTVAIQGIGRVNMADGGIDNGGTTLNPRLYEYKITLANTNWSKQIQSIKFTRTNATGLLHVMAVSVNTIAACGPPANQPTNLILTPTVYGVTGSFTASVPPADKYMVLRSSGGPADTPPNDGNTYTVGSTLGNSTIISVSSATTFSDPGLTIGATYYYTILGYNDATCYGTALVPSYNISNPTIGSTTIPSCSATPAGTYTVGPTGTYPTLTAAMNALNNAAGAAGNIIIELQAAYTSTGETFPIVIPNISTSPCAIGTPTLTIRPAAGATGLLITGSNATAILDFNNAQRATLDGRPGGVGTTSQLTVINTSTAGVAIRLYNDASRNTITYCDVQGQNTSATSSALSGVIYIGQALSATSAGNDYNTISFSNIHGTAGGTPAMGIVAYGTTPRKAAYNDSCSILNCNIYDFFNASVASTGVKVDVGNNAWTINGNSLYQTATRTYAASNTHRGFWITPNVSAIDSTAGAFQITNNYIGGSAVNAGGTAYTMTGTSIASIFLGMDLSLGNGTATSVQNNLISNIALTSTSTSTTGVFSGISTANGNINIGNLVGNTVTNINATTGSAGTVFGIRSGGGATINIFKNSVTALTASGGTVSTNLYGIGVSAGTTVTVSNNMINNLNVTSTGSTTAQTLNGIYVSGGSVTSINADTIMNLTNAYTNTSTSSSTRGIYITSSTGSATSNIIRNLSNAAPSTGSGASSALVGIAMTSTNASGYNIAGNTIYSLVSTSSSVSAAMNITGIFYSGTSSTTNAISKNLIHSFEMATVDTNMVFTGIDYATATATVSNNYIRLGIKADGTAYTTGGTVRGISSNSSSSINNFYYNTIYIGGAGVGASTKATYAFIRTANSGNYDMRNNIFVNARSNASTGGKHYALYFTGATTGATPNNNVYFANGTGGVFGYNGTADVATYTSGWIPGDAVSAYGNPGFINATGSATTFNLHIANGTSSIAESAGASVSFFVSDDYDGDARNATTPDAGADEFSGTNPNLCTGTPAAGTVSVSNSPVCVGSTVTLSVSGSTSAPGITFQWQSSTDSTNWTNISGANTATYTATVTARTFYRIIVTCSGSSSSANSGGIAVNIFTPTYAVYNGTLYTESFENWASTCSTTDLPSISWTNTPSNGNNSWRRHDQQASAAWVNPTLGLYSPVSTVGSYSARFHSYQATSGTQGTLDFYVNMSAAGSATNLKFDYINTSGNDSMVVFISTNGGTTFTRLDSIRTRTAWTTKTIPLTTNSATTVIRFLATSDFGTTDIGMDNLQLVNFASCAGTPVAGTVFSSANPICSGVSFTLSDTAASQLAGITYQWQSSTDSTNWTNIIGATALSYTASQTAITYYRLVVTCANGNAVSYTPGLKINLNSPSNCYCTPTYSLGGTNDYVTSVALLTLSQTTTANTSPYYINYISTQNTIPNLARTNTYPLYLSFGNDGSQYSGVWIDFNQDGVFATTEYFSTAKNATALGKDTIPIVVPAGATLGQTRMRIRGGEDLVLTSAQSCGASSSSYGQAQDYLVNIVDGTVPITLLSFAGERKNTVNNLTWTTASEQNNKGFELQRSADGTNFSAITFVATKAVNGNSTSNLTYTFADTKAITGSNYYRLKQIDNDGKVSYSKIVLLKGDKVNALTLSLVYPNPAKDKLNVIIASPKADKLTLIVSDVAGKIIRQQKVEAVAGDNKFEVNVQSLTSGNYVIKAICNDGCETVISRFVKE